MWQYDKRYQYECEKSIVLLNHDKHHEMQNKNIKKICYEKTDVVTFNAHDNY